MYLTVYNVLCFFAAKVASATEIWTAMEKENVTLRMRADRSVMWTGSPSLISMDKSLFFLVVKSKASAKNRQTLKSCADKKYDHQRVVF